MENICNEVLGNISEGVYGKYIVQFFRAAVKKIIIFNIWTERRSWLDKIIDDREEEEDNRCLSDGIMFLDSDWFYKHQRQKPNHFAVFHIHQLSIPT